MFALLLVALFACLGCRVMPELPAAGEYVPLIAAHVGAVLASTSPAKLEPDTPAPKPSPGICTNCNGKGRIGDGVVSVVCPVCKGKGRTDGDFPVSVEKPVEKPAQVAPAPSPVPPAGPPKTKAPSGICGPNGCGPGRRGLFGLRRK